MRQAYQLTFDDLKNQRAIQAQPNRTAFIDECGSFGFDFSKEGTSKYYTLCAVVVEDSKLSALHDSINEIKKNNGFNDTEIKSSGIGKDNKRRSRIISQLLPIDFRVIMLIADKQSDEKRVQVAFLRYLLFYGQNVSPSNYLYANQIIRDIQEYTVQHITRNYLYRRVIAPLRDEGVIIASSSHGYKIPISVDDIKTYLNSTHTVVSPMLHRIGICRNLILQQTGNHLDVLDDPAFLRYKKYFD